MHVLVVRVWLPWQCCLLLVVGTAVQHFSHRFIQADFSHTEVASAPHNVHRSRAFHLQTTQFSNFDRCAYWHHSLLQVTPCWEPAEFTNTTTTCRRSSGIPLTRRYLTRSASFPLALWFSFTGTSHYSPLERAGWRTGSILPFLLLCTHSQTLTRRSAAGGEGPPGSSSQGSSRARLWRQTTGPGCGRQTGPARPNPPAQPVAAHAAGKRFATRRVTRGGRMASLRTPAGGRSLLI